MQHPNNTSPWAVLEGIDSIIWQGMIAEIAVATTCLHCLQPEISTRSTAGLRSCHWWNFRCFFGHRCAYTTLGPNTFGTIQRWWFLARSNSFPRVCKALTLSGHLAQSRSMDVPTSTILLNSTLFDYSIRLFDHVMQLYVNQVTQASCIVALSSSSFFFSSSSLDMCARP